MRTHFMKPNRIELLLAWMTLTKIKDSYGEPEIDAYDQAILIDMLKTLDKLQIHEGLRAEANIIKLMKEIDDD